jgi:hypothetical protein
MEQIAAICFQAFANVANKVLVDEAQIDEPISL